MRRGLGRGRTLIAIGAIVAIISMPLAWLKVGGVVLGVRTANGFEGSRTMGADLGFGVLVFLSSVSLLAVIVLPFTQRSGRSSLDRPATYVVLVTVGVVGLVLEVLGLLGTEGNSVAPTDVPGLWLAGAGIILATWGVLEVLAERPGPP